MPVGSDGKKVLFYACGVGAVLRELNPFLHPDTIPVTGTAPGCILKRSAADSTRLSVSDKRIGLPAGNAVLDKRRNACKSERLPAERRRGRYRLLAADALQAGEGCEFAFMLPATHGSKEIEQ